MRRTWWKFPTYCVIVSLHSRWRSSSHSLITMSAWDQTIVIGRKARPSGGVRQGPSSLERAKAVGAVTENDRKSA